MPNNANAPNCICPYYVSDRGRMIKCEGMIAGTVIKCVFADERARQTHQERACKTNEYKKRCWLARALDAKYSAKERRQEKA